MHSELAESIRLIERHGYSLLFAWILAEQSALPVIPSVPLLVVVGASIHSGHLKAIPVIACCLAGSLIADSVWFQLGRRRGKRVLAFLCRTSFEPDSCVRQTRNAFTRRGLTSLLFVKFIPGLNTLAAPLAGVSGVRLRSFIHFDMLGVVIWSASYMGIGFMFSDQLEQVVNYIGRMGSGFLFLIGGALFAWILWKFIQRRRLLHQWASTPITPEEMRDRVDAGEKLCIVDLRGPQDNGSSIPGAIRLNRRSDFKLKTHSQGSRSHFAV